MLKSKSLVIVRDNITIAKNVLKAIEKNNQTLKILEASWLEVMYNWNLIDPKIEKRCCRAFHLYFYDM